MYTNVYRDSGNRFQLTAQPDIPALNWTFTTEKRAQWLEGVAQEFENVPKDASVLFVNSVPSLYYVLNYPPSVEHPWLFLLSVEEVDFRLNKMVENQKLPDVVFFPKFNPRSPAWPEKTLFNRESIPIKIDHVRNFLTSNGYYMHADASTYEMWKNKK